MLLKVGIGLVLALIAFVIYVATRPNSFRYERSGFISAPPEKIYPYISQLRRGNLWSPYAQRDPAMKSTYSDVDAEVGSRMEFEGKDSGSGVIEILKLETNRFVQYKLGMLKPFKADNIVEYTLTPEQEGTRFTWTMSGEAGFLSKLISVIIDCDKMIGGDFEVGIANLKKIVELEIGSVFKKENLTEKPEIFQWPSTHFVYIEKVGPFIETAQSAWKEVHHALPEISKQVGIKGTMALYKIEPQMVYRAGAMVDAEPKSLPPGMKYFNFAGGKYSRFILKGSYAQLPEAVGRVFEIASETKIPVGSDFYIEHYANDPTKTPEEKLITEILIPTK